MAGEAGKKRPSMARASLQKAMLKAMRSCWWAHFKVKKAEVPGHSTLVKIHSLELFVLVWGFCLVEGCHSAAEGHVGILTP